MDLELIESQESIPVVTAKEVLDKMDSAILCKRSVELRFNVLEDWAYKSPCIYFLYDSKRTSGSGAYHDGLVYIGQTKKLGARICGHRNSGRVFDRVGFVRCLENELLIMEAIYVELLNPLDQSKPGRYHTESMVAKYGKTNNHWRIAMYLGIGRPPTYGHPQKAKRLARLLCAPRL